MSDALDGVLVVDKPEGVTSHDVVATVRRRLPRGTKVGHTGTLDPFATGVLPIVIGRATRLSRFLTADRKSYRADVAFGASTDSGDRTGAVTSTAAPHALAALDEARLCDVLPRFVGTHRQVPPTYSAKKVDGERAYVLARQGADVTLEAVEVTAHTLMLDRWESDRHVARLALTTSAGYYVRSLARDLGEHLGVPAHLEALRRTASGPFLLDAASPLVAVLEGGVDAIAAARLPLEALLLDLPAVPLDASQVEYVRHGRPLRLSSDQQVGLPEGARVRLLSPVGRLVALAHTGPDDARQLHADLVLL
jgi:tRNA pseudouridine55 synthase